MKAAVYCGKGEVVCRDVPVPEILDGEVLVKIDTCGVCGTDLKKIKDGLVEPPRIFGHEMAGIIAQMGKNVKGWNLGERVAIYHHIPCGKCYYCSVKAFAQCEGYKITGTTAGYAPSGGGFAEYIRVMDWIVEQGMVRLPDHVTYEMASFLEPLNTCLKCIRNCDIQPGETVLITGQGPIGLLLTQLAVQSGAKVIATDMIDFRLQKALQYGAFRALKANDSTLQAQIKDVTDGRGVDLAIVATANNQVIKFALESVRCSGRIMLFAQTKMGDTCALDLGQVCALEKNILGSYSSSVELNPVVAQLIFTGAVQVADLVTHRFPLEQVNPAIDLALHPSVDSLKIVVQPHLG